jgi:predicted acetyltransferase
MAPVSPTTSEGSERANRLAPPRPIRYTRVVDPADYILRPGTADDFDAVADLLSDAFHETYDAEGLEVERAVYEPERAALAWAGEQLVGTSGSYVRELTVPGAIVPSAHVTMVGVEATHRRRGILTRMMGRLFEDAQRAGEPVAHLWASEGRIYQRYGYGLAAARLVIEADREAQLRVPPLDPDGVLRSAAPADAVPDLRKVYEQVRAQRPGLSGRDDRWWAHTLADPTSWRNGATRRHVLIHETGAEVDGYVLWRVREGSGDKPGTVLVRELLATNPAAYQSLWQFLLNVDLTRRVEYPFAAPDEPLLYLVDEPRRLGTTLSDALWLRLVDLPAALSARRYQSPVDVVLAVEDPMLPENSGRWHLTGGPSAASCTRTDRPADLDCDLGALGAAYLGGASLGTLAAAGRVRELVPGTLAPASAAFGWHRAPSAMEVF